MPRLPGRHRHAGRHHRARLLRRRPAHRHQGSRRDRRSRGAAHHQRADRRSARLRPRQGTETDDPRVRPRWRHVRRVGARDRRRRVRSQVHQRRHQLGGDDWDERDHRLARRQFKKRHGVDLSRTAWRCSVCKEAAEKAKIELSPDAVDADQPAVHHRDRRRPAAPRRDADPRQVPGADRRPARALPSPFEQASRTRASPRATSTTSILVGGSTRMPAVPNSCSLTGKEPNKR